MSSILQRNLYFEMKQTIAARGNFMLIICPFGLSELCGPALPFLLHNENVPCYSNSHKCASLAAILR